MQWIYLSNFVKKNIWTLPPFYLFTNIPNNWQKFDLIQPNIFKQKFLEKKNVKNRQREKTWFKQIIPQSDVLYVNVSVWVEQPESHHDLALCAFTPFSTGARPLFDIETH